MIRACLEQFDFPLCASKPDSELSKAASEVVVKIQRGGKLSLRAPELCS